MDADVLEDSIEIYLTEEEESRSGSSVGAPQAQVSDVTSQPQTEQQPSRSSGSPSSANALSLNHQLQSLLDAGGGLRAADSLEAYFKLCEKANTWDRRGAMLAAIQAASDVVLTAFVSEDGMRRVLQGWLEEALAATNTQCVSNMLTTLSRLPATKESLLAPCRLPTIVNRITKDTEIDGRIASEARMIIVKWRKLFPKKKPSAGVPPREVEKNDAVEKKKEAVSIAGGEKILNQKAHSATKNVSTSAGKPQKRKPDPNNGLFEDVDVFAAQKKPAKQPGTSNTTNPAISENKGPNAAKGTTRVRVVASNAALSKAAPKAQPKATQVARVSTNPLDMLGMNQGDTSSSQAAPPKRQRRIALVRASDPLPVAATAAERAKAAADRVPDEAPRQRRLMPHNKSKVAWADGWGPQTPPTHPEKLVKERMFLKNDPPVRVRSDAVFDEKARAALQDAHTDLQSSHKQFEMAARKQHHSEAQALKEFKAKEDQERREVEQRVREMRPTSTWKIAPDIPRDILVGLGESLQPARGGQSTEVSNRIRLRHSLPPASHALESPEEPPPGSNVPVRPLHLIPKIPLSVEEAKPAQASRQRPPEQQVAPRSTGPRRMLGLHGLHGTGGRAQTQGNARVGTAVPGIPNASGGLVGQRTSAGARPSTVCKFFNTPQGCQRGDQCYYQHVAYQHGGSSGNSSGNSSVRPTQPMRRQTTGPPRPGERRPMKR